jgi:hypothetical protein
LQGRDYAVRVDADAFAVATAVEFNAVLLTSNPEIELLEGEQNLRVEWLPGRP